MPSSWVSRTFLAALTTSRRRRDKGAETLHFFLRVDHHPARVRWSRQPLDISQLGDLGQLVIELGHRQLGVEQGLHREDLVVHLALDDVGAEIDARPQLGERRQRPIEDVLLAGDVIGQHRGGLIDCKSAGMELSHLLIAGAPGHLRHRPDPLDHLVPDRKGEGNQ